ncbi:L-threonine 3-dehydrogenase [Streptomyces sp. NPDC007205]|uniref:L-threonine 3-dehydrogenase n=1 Tax=Streptomyces sp. NPDC007205 TaxID=3154316 RepID=UPI0034002102
MKALVKAGPEEGVELREVPRPQLGRNDVLIRVLRTGICGTDLHIHHSTPWALRRIAPPRIIGHEFVGEIIAVGEGVGSLLHGQLVSGEGHLTCGRCPHCTAGRKHLCPHTRTLGVDRDGAFAEYITLPADHVWVHRPGVTLDVAAIFDAFGNAVHIADAFPLQDRTVLVAGAGPIGCMAAAIAVHRDAHLVVVTDVNQFRLDLARRIGIHHVVEAEPHAIAKSADEFGLREGFDIGFEMSGNHDALQELLTGVKRGGQVAVLGLPDDRMSTDWADIALRMLTIQGISGRRVFDTWHCMSELLDQGMDPSLVITHHFAADDYGEAFAAAFAGSAGKVILNWAEPNQENEE